MHDVRHSRYPDTACIDVLASANRMKFRKTAAATRLLQTLDIAKILGCGGAVTDAMEK
jgi:hypothetical protein